MFYEQYHNLSCRDRSIFIRTVTQSEAQQNNILAGSCVFWPLEGQKLSHVKLAWLKENSTNIEQKKTETLLSILPLYRTIMAGGNISTLTLYFMNSGFRPMLLYSPCGLPKCAHWPLSLSDYWKRKSFLDESNPSDNCHSNIRQCNSRLPSVFFVSYQTAV